MTDVMVLVGCIVIGMIIGANAGLLASALCRAAKVKK